MTDQPALPIAGDEVERRKQWVEMYISTLPGELRPHTWDQRARNAMRTAYANGWRPAQLAGLVALGNYRRINNQPLAALKRLEDIGGHPPAATPRPLHATGCPVCPPWAKCQGHAAVIPPQWTQERLELLRQLRVTPVAELPEETRGQLMADLIRAQRER